MIAATIYHVLPLKEAVVLLTVFLSSFGVVGTAWLLKHSQRPRIEILVAMLLFATYPPLVSLGSLLRGYGPMMALVPFVWWWYQRARQTREGRDFVAVSLGCALLCGFHLYGIFVGLGLLIHGCLFERRGVTTLVSVAVVFAAMIATVFGLVRVPFLEYLEEQGGEARYQGLEVFDVIHFVASGQPWLLLIALVGIVVCGRRRWSDLWLTVAPLGCALVAIWGTRPFVFPRFFGFFLPSLVLFYAAALTPKPGRRVRPVIMGLILTAFFTATWWPLPRTLADPYGRERIEKALRAYTSHQLFVAGQVGASVRYYVPRAIELNDVQTLENVQGDHVILAHIHRHRWARNLPEVDAYLRRNYREVWRPSRGDVSSRLCDVQLLIPK